MKNTIISFCLVVLFLVPKGAFATEGMWLPLLLQSLNEAEMQAMGMKMTAEDIYSINHGSLKDAIGHFNGGCTSEVISSKGLLLTNHHCGYSQIQSHSTLENNYLKDGFWAQTLEDELPNKSLFVTFIDRIEDVSKMILNGVKSKMSPKEVQSQVDKNIAQLKSSMKLDKFQEVIVKPFFKGNQYFMFITTTYNDVRLVGTPPESIGKFGSDTDNWIWPRHTGDFSMFRIYAGPNNEPAEYSENNIPYTPKHFLPVSLDGVEKGDFTMVFGFPGRTNQYLPAIAVDQMITTLNPAKIEIRDAALKILDKHMKKDAGTRLKYASKFARIANYWKKWIGERQGLMSMNAVGVKKELEVEFSEKVDAKRKFRKKYGNVLQEFEENYTKIKDLAHARDYYSEVTRRNVELLGMVHYVVNLASKFDKENQKAFEDYKVRVVPFLSGKYKNYNADIDKEVALDLLTLMQNNVNKDLLSPKFKEANIKELVDRIYSSKFVDAKGFESMFSGTNEDVMDRISNDPAFMIYKEMRSFYNENVSTPYNDIKVNIDATQKVYMAGLIELFPNKRFFPDANSTMRVAYGQVNGYDPMDAVTYKPVTYLDGVVEKYQPGDYEFDVPAKLLQLHKDKDYGQYADKNGKIPVCFLGTNHTTGGNSGSPTIDAHGNLIGLNFDRVWEGTMSDIYYDKKICRNIMVDIRYVLFIVDKYAGATRLIDEMKLVHPKKL